MGLLDDGSLLAREDPLVAEVLDGGGQITCYLVPGKNLISVMISITIMKRQESLV